MTKKINKQEAKSIIEDFFKDIKNKNSKDLKKIKKLAMSHNLKLGEKRKSFCKNCDNIFVLGKNCEIKINKKTKSIKCLNCGFINRYKLKNKD
jgi:RNase P subunit RPR2